MLCIFNFSVCFYLHPECLPATIELVSEHNQEETSYVPKSRFPEVYRYTETDGHRARRSESPAYVELHRDLDVLRFLLYVAEQFERAVVRLKVPFRYHVPSC